MKFIVLIFAIFAFAQAGRFDALEAYSGFSSKLGISVRSTSQLIECLRSLETFTAPLTKSYNPVQTFFQFVMASDEEHSRIIKSAFEELSENIAPVCSKYFMTLGHSLTNGQFSQPRYNIRMHSEHLIAKTVLLVELVETQRMREAGETFAYILQVVFGSVVPYTPVSLFRPSTELNTGKVQIEVMWTRLVNSVAKSLGLPERVEETQVKALYDAILKASSVYFNGILKLHSATTQVEKIIIELNTVRDLINELNEVSGVAIITFQPFLRYLPYQIDWRSAAFRTLRNVLVNLPEVHQLDNEFARQFRNFEPIAAGKTLAELIKLLTTYQTFLYNPYY